MMRRVSPLLVTSNTIFDIARRSKTLLVMPNIHRGNDTTVKGRLSLRIEYHSEAISRWG
jgi:hypothetical protein